MNCRFQMNKTLRKLATKYAWAFIGNYYKWGGDDPSGFDCSGLCIEILKALGKLPRGGFDCRARDLFKRFSKVEIPKEGCLVFYGEDKDNIAHVEYCIDSKHTIGASGGGRHTLCIEDAIADNAFIKVRPINYKRGVVGFVDPFNN